MLGEKLLALRKKQGYSQQEVADRLHVSRQTISNWESSQGAPALDKALELASLYHISLDDLAKNNVEIKTQQKDAHLLNLAKGKTCILEVRDINIRLDFPNNLKVKVLDIDDEWMKIEYMRKQENSLFKNKKEKITQLIDLSLIDGFSIEEDEE